MKKQQEKVLCLCIGTGAGSAFLENGEALKKKRRQYRKTAGFIIPLSGIPSWMIISQ
ncbi:MAG: hypothetical protein ACLR2E_15320 [Lachnospiraceae bacterium]